MPAFERLRTANDPDIGPDRRVKPQEIPDSAPSGAVSAAGQGVASGDNVSQTRNTARDNEVISPGLVR
jgi:hypothetical protein